MFLFQQRKKKEEERKTSTNTSIIPGEIQQQFMDVSVCVCVWCTDMPEFIELISAMKHNFCI